MGWLGRQASIYNPHQALVIPDDQGNPNFVGRKGKVTLGQSGTIIKLSCSFETGWSFSINHSFYVIDDLGIGIFKNTPMTIDMGL